MQKIKRDATVDPFTLSETGIPCRKSRLRAPSARLQVKLDPENFVQEDKDEVLKVSPKRWVIGNELGSDCKSLQELDTDAKAPCHRREFNPKGGPYKMLQMILSFVTKTF
jgi:hypothetical protein